jgi:hypothetical protein
MQSLRQNRLVAFVFLLTVVPSFPWAAGAEAPAADVRTRLARVPQPWKPPMHRLTWEQYEETLRFWAERHPASLVLESRGTTREKRPLYLLRITDKSVPDADKQVCLITALHSGNERSGGNTVLTLAEWLLADEPEAAEIRRKQMVLLMPILNPFGFFGPDNAFNSQNVDPYTGARGKLWDLKTMVFTLPDRCPEIQAFAGVVDQYRPEVHADVHGISEDYRGQTMFEITGAAYSNFTLRPWDWRVTEAMIAAGRQAGYGSERFEADAQRIFWGPALDGIADRVWLGRPYFYTAHYGYAKYHTMMIAMEVGWEQSGAARLKGLLRLGNAAWEGEPVAGYPVDRLKSYCGHFVVAWGVRSEDRRRSRVELWQRQGGFSQAMLYPQTDGRESYAVALTDKAGKLLTTNKARFLANLKGRPGFCTEAIEAFFQEGPETAWLANEDGPAVSRGDRPIQHGLALRLRLPYRNPELVDLRLNGHLIPESRTDGYQRWFADGYTQVQINVPPETSRQNDLFVVTCAYRPDVQRENGWRPSKEVLERIERRKQGS